MGIFFIIYAVLFLPEFRNFTVHVKLNPLEQHENAFSNPTENTGLLEGH